MLKLKEWSLPKHKLSSVPNILVGHFCAGKNSRNQSSSGHVTALPEHLSNVSRYAWFPLACARTCDSGFPFGACQPCQPLECIASLSVVLAIYVFPRSALILASASRLSPSKSDIETGNPRRSLSVASARASCAYVAYHLGARPIRRCRECCCGEFVY